MPRATASGNVGVVVDSQLEQLTGPQKLREENADE